MHETDRPRRQRFAQTIVGFAMMLLATLRILAYDFAVFAPVSGPYGPGAQWLDAFEASHWWDLIVFFAGSYLSTAALWGRGHALRRRLAVASMLSALVCFAQRLEYLPPESSWCALLLCLLTTELLVREWSASIRPVVRGSTAVLLAMLIVGFDHVVPPPETRSGWWQDELPVPGVWAALMLAVAVHQLYAWRSRWFERALRRPTAF